MPRDNPTIVITNSPHGAKRVVRCTFEHDGISAEIVLQDAMDPEVSPGLEQMKARRLLASLGAALADAIGD
jgi:hypothetical protein